MSDKPGLYGIEDALSSSSAHAIYKKTLSGLRPDDGRVEAVESSVRFSNYHFEPATIFPSGTISADQVAEVLLGWPSEIRLTSGDILFVHQKSKEALLTFINWTNAKIQRRWSVWSMLLDPFLDTSEDQSTIDNQFAQLQTMGLTREAVNNLRCEVAPAMMAYNFGTTLWEWGSLGLYDVLRAQHAHLSQKDFADFYSRALRLAQSDPVSEWTWRPLGESTLSMEVFTVLLDWYPREKSTPKNFNKLDAIRNEGRKQLQDRLTTELASSYSEVHRRYHTLAHIEHCLHELGCVWNYAVRRHEIGWALLFHDAIYDSRRNDNELRSADWACAVMEEMKRPQDEQMRVRELIMATAHSGEPRTADESLLLDIDLSILGAEADVFDEYDRDIRVEYDFVEGLRYREARAKVLQRFLDRPRIFRTSLFYQRYEARARDNLRRALERLSVR